MVELADLELDGFDWARSKIHLLPLELHHETPRAFVEAHRYLPESVTPMPGPMRLDVNPPMIEILECFDVDSPVREVALKKGVQVTYTTILESVLFYYAFHVRTIPCMFVTADAALSQARVENNIIPMIQQGGFQDRVRSSDVSNVRKSGMTKNHIQWSGGGFLVPFGAQSPRKARQFAILLMLMDEVDGWPNTLGADGDPVELFKARCSSYWLRRKIFMGSTPLIKGSSYIQKQFLRGDQRQYHVLCRKCNFAQVLRWSGTNDETGEDYGFKWEVDGGQLVHESVRYLCKACGHEHYEHDKERLFSLDEGAHWQPTARPVEPDIRSYHLPALYSPLGMQPWYRCVAQYLEAWDSENRRVRDINKFQVFYNNVLGEPFEVIGNKIHFAMVSGHRRAEYRLGEVPNAFAAEYSGSPILFLVCAVDVHKHFLAVSVVGWTRLPCQYLIEYIQLRDDSPEGCLAKDSPVWGQLREIIEEKTWTAQDGKTYRIVITLVDAGFENELVTNFCSEYEAGVYPFVGRDRPARFQKIQEFAPFKTQAGYLGYRVLVDFYKDRLAPVLRRDWQPLAGIQQPYHFNAPIDLPDRALKELTKETRREVLDKRGRKSYEWYRPGNARNELWDLLVASNAGMEILAHNICRVEYERDLVDWNEFWKFVEAGAFYE
jgi:phage terminase large subunit GpA-like protein